jgi:CheY-like chemotaxis protein
LDGKDDFPSGAYRILCVDDDLVVLQARKVLLESEGYVVVVVDCPLEALRQDFSVIDLALVDYDMPAMNGRDLLLRMRASKATFPIVLLSGQAYGLPVEVRVLFSACLEKGAPVREVLAIIERFRRQGDVLDGA